MPWLCQPFKDQGLVRESSEAEQAFGSPGYSHGNCKADWATAMAVDRYSVPCLCPAREGAGLPQPDSLLTWHRVYLSYSVGSFIASWKLCHLSLGIIVCGPPPPERLDSDNWWLADFSQCSCLNLFPCRTGDCEGHGPFSSHFTISCFCPLLIEKGAQREESPSNSSWLCWEPLLRDSLWTVTHLIISAILWDRCFHDSCL